MQQFKKFMNPVYKSDGTNRPIEAGDTVKFILKDGSTRDETVTATEDGSRWVAWDLTVNTTRKEDVRAVESQHHFDCTQYGGSDDPHDGGNDPI